MPGTSTNIHCAQRTVRVKCITQCLAKRKLPRFSPPFQLARGSRASPYDVDWSYVISRPGADCSAGLRPDRNHLRLWGYKAGQRPVWCLSGSFSNFIRSTRNASPGLGRCSCGCISRTAVLIVERACMLSLSFRLAHLMLPRGSPPNYQIAKQ